MNTDGKKSKKTDITQLCMEFIQNLIRSSVPWTQLFAKYHDPSSSDYAAILFKMSHMA